MEGLRRLGTPYFEIMKWPGAITGRECSPDNWLLEWEIEPHTWRFVLRWIRLAPVTAESLVLCVAMFASCAFEAVLNHDRFEDVQRAWGAIGSLNQFSVHDGVRRVKEPELNGPFDVWDGEWWRVPLTAFHHASLPHLVFNLGAAWFLGRCLERRWGSLRMAIFLVPAVCIPIMAELCCGNAVLGFSGAICAMLGALVVLRQFDSELAEALPAATEIGMAIIVLAWLATLCDIVSCANVAHLTGFLYGGMIAATTCGPLRHVVLLRVSVVLIHLWLVPGLVLVTHPFWIARYHWYHATTLRTPQRAEKSLERATQFDPLLAGAWLRWSQFAEERGDLEEAWRRLVNGLAVNPSNAPLMDSTRRMWRHLEASQRRDAEGVLARFFGKRAAAWLVQIQASVSPSEFDVNEESGTLPQDIDVSEFALDQKLEPPLMIFVPTCTNRPTPMDPNDLNDAVEGRSL